MLAALVSFALAAPAVRDGTDYDAPSTLSAKAREAAAALRRPVVEALFATAGVAWPPRELLLRAYKAEMELEVWAAAAEGPLTHVTTYRVCAASGGPGPKRREGDFQVPEGFYTLDLFNPWSDYHLSMRVSYPNASDKVRSDPKRPGGAIMIHGSCASIGCLAMTDERIEELWVMATAMRTHKRTTHVHSFPTHDMTELLATGGPADHVEVWTALARAQQIVDLEHRMPRVRFGRDGSMAVD